MFKFKIVRKKFLKEQEQKIKQLTEKVDELQKELIRKTPKRDKNGKFISKKDRKSW